MTYKHEDVTIEEDCGEYTLFIPSDSSVSTARKKARKLLGSLIPVKQFRFTPEFRKARRFTDGALREGYLLTITLKQPNKLLSKMEVV